MHQYRLLLTLMCSLAVLVSLTHVSSEEGPAPTPAAAVQVLQHPCTLTWDPVTSCQTTGTDAVPCTPQTYRLYVRLAPTATYAASPAAEVSHPTTRVTCEALDLPDDVVYAAAVTAVGVRESLALTAPESPRSPDVLFRLAPEAPDLPDVQVLQRPCALAWDPVTHCETTGSASVPCTPHTYRLYLRRAPSSLPSLPVAEVTHPNTRVSCEALDLADHVVYRAVVTAIGVRDGMTLTAPESPRSAGMLFRVNPGVTLP